MLLRASERMVWPAQPRAAELLLHLTAPAPAQDTQDSSMGVRITKARESAAREAGLRPSTAKQKKPKSGAKKQDRKKPQSGCVPGRLPAVGSRSEVCLRCLLLQHDPHSAGMPEGPTASSWHPENAGPAVLQLA